MRGVSPKTDLDRLKDQQAKEVLLKFLQAVAIKRYEAKATYLPPLQSYPQDIERPQVFFSYAWGQEGDPRFQALQNFLKDLEQDFGQAGIRVWLDLSRMIGNVDEQMRAGVFDSNLILLMGTRLYAQKIQMDPPRNVRQELKHGLERAKDIHACSLVPWVLEGKALEIFPNLGDQHVRQDASSWLLLDATQGSAIQDMQAYIRTLTSLRPVGLLAGALGLHRLDDYPEYRTRLRASYESCQALLMKELAEIYSASKNKLDDKCFTFSIKNIPFEQLKFGDRKGRGSFGTVHEGKWNNIPVAIKEIDGAITEESESHFKTETEVMVRANSPWVVSLYGVSKAPGRMALVMEYMSQGSLNQLLHSKQPLSWSLRYQMAADIGRGLLVLHGKGILHCDLKSDNVLLDGYRAKLSDFGLSKVKTTSRSSSHRGGPSVGTEGWMAPELFLDFTVIAKDPITGKRVLPKVVYTEQSDIYGYSMILWEMASRKSPYAEMGLQGSNLQNFVKIGEREEIPDECPEAFAELIEGGWKQKPEERLPLAWMIERLQALIPAPQGLVTLSVPAPSPAPVVFSRPAPVTPVRAVTAISTPEPVAVAIVDPNSGLSVSGLREALPVVAPALILASSPVVALPSNVVAFRSPSPPQAHRPSAPPELPQFLRLVAEGEQEQAEAMLQKNRDLALFPGKVKDLSGRTFEGITGFQYALWALDSHMWTMLRHYLADDQAADQLVTTGPWVRTHGLHAGMPGGPLEKLTTALKTHVDNFDAWYEKSNWTALEQCWSKQVGGAQLLLPAHVINEYCRPDRSFEPCPSFMESTLPRTRKFDKGEWFTASYNGGKLGEKFGVLRYNFSGGGLGGMVGVGGVRSDLRSLTSLVTIRSQQREELLTELSQYTGLEGKRKVAARK